MNDELKKKIAKIIDNAFENRCRKTNCHNCDLYPDEMCQPNMYADALIAAGIGDINAAVKDAAERIKNALFCEFANDMTFKMASRIEKVIKEVCDAGETERN